MKRMVDLKKEQAKLLDKYNKITELIKTKCKHPKKYRYSYGFFDGKMEYFDYCNLCDKHISNWYSGRGPTYKTVDFGDSNE